MQWFNIWYTPNRMTNDALEFRGQIWGTRNTAAQALAALRRGHTQQAIEGWYMTLASTGEWL